MKAAIRPGNNAKLMVVRNHTIEHSSIESLVNHLEPGDVVVVNDAATFPASLECRTDDGSQFEVRLLSEMSDGRWTGVTLGRGDWRTPTELREPPPQLEKGHRVWFDRVEAVVTDVSATSERLVSLDFNLGRDAFWRFVYEKGHPIQYSYMSLELNLWSVQNIYSSRPWASEMPSAGHALTWRVLLSLFQKGVKVVSLTHAAGVSSTGDERIDTALPLSERFEIPSPTLDAIERARSAGQRVVAIGTSVVRALESHARGLTQTTNLRISPGERLLLVDALVTGTHDATESHYALIAAFLSPALLRRVSSECEQEEYLTHEFGDLCLIFDHSAVVDDQHPSLINTLEAVVA